MTNQSALNMSPDYYSELSTTQVTIHSLVLVNLLTSKVTATAVPVPARARIRYTAL